MSSTTDPETPPTTAEPDQAERREYRAYCGCCDLMWLVATVEGWLKLLQWITTFLAFVIILAFFNEPIKNFSQKPEYNFMIFVGITSWVFINIHIVLKVSHLFEKMPSFLRHPAVGIACSLVATLSFLAASSVVLAYAKGWSELEASAACGYIAMFLFLFEAIYLFIRGRRAAAARGEKPQKKKDKVTEKAGDKDQAVELLHEEKKEGENEKEDVKIEEEKKEEEKKEEENVHPFPK